MNRRYSLIKMPNLIHHTKSYTLLVSFMSLLTLILALVQVNLSYQRRVAISTKEILTNTVEKKQMQYANLIMRYSHLNHPQIIEKSAIKLGMHQPSKQQVRIVKTHQPN